MKKLSSGGGRGDEVRRWPPRRDRIVQRADSTHTSRSPTTIGAGQGPTEGQRGVRCPEGRRTAAFQPPGRPRRRLPGEASSAPCAHAGQSSGAQAAPGARAASAGPPGARFPGGVRPTIAAMPVTVAPERSSRAAVSMADPPVVTTSSTTSARSPPRPRSRAAGSARRRRARRTRSARRGRRRPRGRPRCRPWPARRTTSTRPCHGSARAAPSASATSGHWSTRAHWR